MTILMTGGDRPLAEPAVHAMCKCGAQLEWVACDNCDDGHMEHDCSGDNCSCLEPEGGVECNVCDGHGGLLVCPNCVPHE